ncbi:MAG TPA: NAD(P)/FAD-dependent oxidoreductase, partial [Fimbriimonas sp.]|nr:NAD(P)/FAD-dependent oxidoreductase [Fimbriimonas sp.]
MYDVVIIGGGPAGSTAGTFLKKFNPDLRVAIVEREVFPRDHVGESQLPPIAYVLEEMGCWDRVEAAGFPIKIGATYKWGKSPELWDFEFFPSKLFKEEPRPAKFEGQRRFTAFQVDRAIYDQILLDHSEELGCEVRQGARVSKFERDGDRVASAVLDSGEAIEGRFYIDASGHSGVLRRAMGVQTHSPTSLQNIAIWDYWQNADWAVEIGTGGTRVQVMSLGHGWIWFIPLGPTRTSVGLVIPVEYYKQSGKRPSDLYGQALLDEPRIAELMKNAVSEGKMQTTNDWSFL